jgi:hypothetical protein
MIPALQIANRPLPGVVAQKLRMPPRNPLALQRNIALRMPPEDDRRSLHLMPARLPLRRHDLEDWKFRRIWHDAANNMATGRGKEISSCELRAKALRKPATHNSLSKKPNCPVTAE